MKKTIITLLSLSFSIFSLSINAQSTIAAGSNFSVFLCKNGDLMSSGNNGFGQLAEGVAGNKSTATVVSGQTGVVSVAASTHTLFVKSDGTVWACGQNWSGELGNGAAAAAQVQDLPTQVVGLSDVKTVACGASFSLFLKKDSTVWSCGSNGNGQLGDGTTTARYAPVEIVGLTGVVKIAAADYYSLFLKADGTVWKCGYFFSNTPKQITELSGIVDIACGNQSSLFVKNDGTVYGEGGNNYGMLAGATLTTSSPYLSGIVKVARGRYHSLFLKDDGTVYSAGINNKGQLGDGTINSSSTESTPPVQVIGLSEVVEIAVGTGSYHSLFLKNDGSIYACGQNGNGELGDGSSTNQGTVVLASSNCSGSTGTLIAADEAKITDVYPNPGNDVFTFISDKSINLLEIFSSVGEEVYSSTINSAIAQVNLSILPAGIYVYKITSGSEKSSGKLVIQ